MSPRGWFWSSLELKVSGDVGSEHLPNFGCGESVGGRGSMTPSSKVRVMQIATVGMEVWAKWKRGEAHTERCRQTETGNQVRELCRSQVKERMWAKNLQSICGTWLSMLFLGSKGTVAPSGLFDEKADTLLVLRATSGLVMDNGGVAMGFVRFDVDAVVVVVVDGPAFEAAALARNCASAEPVPGAAALAVTRFFLESLGQHGHDMDTGINQPRFWLRCNFIRLVVWSCSRQHQRPVAPAPSAPRQAPSQPLELPVIAQLSVVRPQKDPSKGGWSGLLVEELPQLNGHTDASGDAGERQSR